MKGKGGSTKDDIAFDKPASRPFLDGTTALAYTAGVMPQIYGATLAVLQEARRCFDLFASDEASDSNVAWRPRKIVDWGAGVGSAAW